MAGRTYDALIVGGGIIGHSAAHRLATTGMKVALIDAGKARQPATEAAAGLLAPLSHTPIPGRGFEITQESRSLWESWAKEIADLASKPFEYDRSGAFVVATTDQEAVVLKTIAKRADQFGEPRATVDAECVRIKIPDIHPDTSQALHLPNEHRVDNVAFSAALREANRQLGVRVLEREALGASVQGASVLVDTADGAYTAGLAVLAIGAWTKLLDGYQQLAIEPVRGQMIRVRGAEWNWQGMIRIGDHYAVRRGASDVLFGATVEREGFSNHTTATGLGSLLEAFAAKLPGLAAAPVVDTWSGLRPASPDGKPLVGVLGSPQLFVATGHYRDGILLAPWTARQIEQWAQSPSDWTNEPDFDPQRFAT